MKHVQTTYLRIADLIGIDVRFPSQVKLQNKG